MDLTHALHYSMLVIRGFSKAIENNCEAFAQKYGLSHAHHHVLYLLQMEGDLRVGQLAEIGLWHNSTVTRLLTGLKKMGLITTRSNQKDARMSFVSITELGKELLEQMQRDAMADPDFLPFVKRIHEVNPVFLEEMIKGSFYLLDFIHGENYVKWLQQSADLKSTM